MKKTIIFTLLALLTLGFVGCKNGQKGKCHIVGTIPEKWNGKRIFLVPLRGPKDAAHVDSIEVKDGKFEFWKDTCQMEIIRLDYHFRIGLQELLVVTEPGTLNVTIGENSSASGTPQNDSLQVWKMLTESHNRQRGTIMKQIRAITGDSARVNALKSEADSIRKAYKQQTRDMAARLEEGVLKEFLSGLFPTSYKKRMPDGSVQEIQRD